MSEIRREDTPDSVRAVQESGGKDMKIMCWVVLQDGEIMITGERVRAWRSKHYAHVDAIEWNELQGEGGHYTVRCAVLEVEKT